MTTPAVRLLTISVTPCSLLHNDAPIVGGVDLLGLNPDRDRFDVARSSDFDSSLSFTIAPQRINLLIHEPTGLKWESRPELETWLPPVRIQTRQGTTIKTELELGSSTPLEAPISVVRSGSDTDLMIWIRSCRFRASRGRWGCRRGSPTRLSNHPDS